MGEADFKMNSVNQVKNSLVQLVIGSLRNWVLERKEPFTISDIWLDPELSKDFCVNEEMVRAVRAALLKLNCEVIGVAGLGIEIFQAPKVIKIDRDLLVS